MRFVVDLVQDSIVADANAVVVAAAAVEPTGAGRARQRAPARR